MGVEGLRLEIAFDEQYKAEYERLVQTKSLRSLPIEYYRVSWTGFDRNIITPRMIPIKSFLIDSTNYCYQNGSDLYISRIVKELLNDDYIVAITQAHRRIPQIAHHQHRNTRNLLYIICRQSANNPEEKTE